ncbi:uncharacterized protein LOC129567060 isoform X2 [Sitodiplosis mosellana]|uniref:uncharacterized protein LOC129567060 isoform X2 n=1 Tax=Sitodiplosis mosellana TaxID=263140 RepID=UPI002443FD26|nr:uncharacterized protein LOC129567060 isoform X2 [Sitodiplosis mosellana]
MSATNDIELVKKAIKIMQVDSPHKFWYKYCEDSLQDRLIDELECEIAAYVVDLLTRDDQVPALNDGDVIAVHHPHWNKWIRGKSGRKKKAKKDGEIDMIYVWAIDYGCKLLFPLKDVLPLTNMRLAYRRPINVHIGGLSNVVPARLEFNEVLFDMERVKTHQWSKKATELFSEWVGDESRLTFLIESVESNRCFGQVLIYCHNNNEPFSVVGALMEQDEAIQDRCYMNDVKTLEKDDFFRLNHEITMPRAEDQIDEMAGYHNIWMDADDPMSFDDAQQIEIASGNDEPERQPPPSQSGTHGNSALTGHSMSTVSMTLSIKSLNKWNVLAITHDVVVPTKDWKDTFYFKDQIRSCLKRLFRDKIDPLCSYAWPTIMRGNSCLMVGERDRNTMLVLPTICTIVHRMVTDWTTSVRIEPIGLIFVSGAEKVEPMATICRKLLQKSGMAIVNVTCLNSNFEINALLQMDHVDILVLPIFCFKTLVNHMPKIFKVGRLQYAWFDEIDKMCQINEVETYKAVDILCTPGLDMQVAATGQTYNPILNVLYDRIKIPMLLIGDRTPFEAALCAECIFVTEFIMSEGKINDLIEKLLDQHGIMTGSIVIVCSNLSEVKYVTGSLTQANIKCKDFDNTFSLNQLKLVNWTEQGLNVNTSLTKQNILVCEDANLDSFPIRTASHIVHYSLPNELQTFLYRFITCFGYYAEKLDRELLNKPDRHELSPPICLTYFDDEMCDEFIQIYDVLSNRTQTELPVELSNLILNLKQKLEEIKANKPLCIQLITRAKDCDISCPYRHILSDFDETCVPEYGFVNMELLEVLAPNHFAVRVIGHKRKLEHKSKPVENYDFERKQFERSLREYYSLDGSLEQADRIVTGQMYLYFYQNRPKRCRVVTQSKKAIQIYLIDDGKLRQCNEHELYSLDVDFEEFPSRAIEIFVSGYVPNDNNIKWLPEAKQFVERMMSSLRERDHNESYLQAEVIRCFDRRLIVRDLKILYKVQNQLQGKLIARSLIKFRMAEKAPLVLHNIFLDTPNSSQMESEAYTESRDDNGTTDQKDLAREQSIATQSVGIQNLSTQSVDTQIVAATSIPPAPVDIWNDLNSISQRYTSGYASAHSLAFDDDNKQTMNIPLAPANSTVSLIEFGWPQNSSEIAFGYGQTQSVFMKDVIQPVVAVASNPSVDEIFGSLPEDIQAAEVLSPIKCDSNQIDETDHGAQEPENQDNWLIKFSDSDDEDSNIEPSPFAYVRLINSYDDL